MRNRAMETLRSLADCVRTEISDRDLAPFCAGGIQAGQEVPWDYASDCDGANGQWWVRLMTFYPSTNFPEPVVGIVTDVRRLPYAMGVEIAMTRSIPGLGDDMRFPTDEENEQAAALQMDDMLAMRAAISCCFGTSDSVVIQPYTPLGPQGGVVGGMFAIYTELVR